MVTRAPWWLRGALLALLLVALGSAQQTPSAPFLDLTVLSGSSIQASFKPPLSDGGAAINAYNLAWDTDPGVQEVQTVTTSAYVGPNEIQSITTTATVSPEVQTLTLTADVQAEIQRITVTKATGGYFFLELDTSAVGGSLQYSGYIEVNYPANGPRESVAQILSSMNNIAPFGSVTVASNVIDANTYEYLVTFPLGMGNVPQMVVHAGQLSPIGTADAQIATDTEGNIIDGTFRLGFAGHTTEDIPYDASEYVLRTKLEALPNIGTVIVTRSGPNDQHGYVWTITFDSDMNAGNIVPLVPDKTGLFVSSAGKDCKLVVTSKDGNELGGSFGVTYTTLSLVSGVAVVPFNASADQFKHLLETAMVPPLIPSGTIAVTRSGPDGQKGYSWTVTFLNDYARTFEGDLKMFSTTILGGGANLTGSGAAATPFEVRKGTIKTVQLIAVTHAGTVNTSTHMELTFGSYTTRRIKLRPNSTSCASSVTPVQTITSSTVDTTTSGGDSDVSMYLQFRLQYGNEVTDWINANPLGNTGSCTPVATSIADALQQFKMFDQVLVYGVSTGPSQGCVWTVNFVSSIGDIDTLLVQSRNTVAGALGVNGFVSKAGDDTITTLTTVHGVKNSIKSALELLPNIGTVTVTPVSYQQGIGGQCSWRVTFDTNAGSPVPLLQASIFDNLLPATTGSLRGSVTTASSGTSSGTTVTITNAVVGTSTAIGGFFTLTFRGARTSYLSYQATQEEVRNALEALSTIGSVSVVRSVVDENNGYTWTIQFLTELGYLDLLEFDAAT